MASATTKKAYGERIRSEVDSLNWLNKTLTDGLFAWSTMENAYVRYNWQDLTAGMLETVLEHLRRPEDDALVIGKVFFFDADGIRQEALGVRVEPGFNGQFGLDERALFLESPHARGHRSGGKEK